MSPRKPLVIAAVVLVAALAGYLAWGANQKRLQHKAIAAAVAEGTQQLKEALAGKAGDEQLKKVDATLAALRATSASRQIDFAGAAEGYLVSVHGIVQRRLALARLEPAAEASEKALSAHMGGPRGRDDGWIRRATELKKQSDQAHYELALAARTLGDLLEENLPAAELRLAPYVDKSALLEEPLREASLKQARADAKQATEAQAASHHMLQPR